MVQDENADSPISSANSSSLGSRPKTSCNFMAVRRILAILSTRCTGSRIVLDWLASARLMDCLIHHEPKLPLEGSNRSTTFISPMLPSLIKSRGGPKFS